MSIRPVGHGAMRIVAFITQTSVIDQILTHLRPRAGFGVGGCPTGASDRSPSASPPTVTAVRTALEAR